VNLHRLRLEHRMIMKIYRHPPHSLTGWRKEVRRYETCRNCKTRPAKGVNAGVPPLKDCCVDPASPWNNSGARSLHQRIEDIAPSQATAIDKRLWFSEDCPVVRTHISARMIACET
jgi:hypothetical protein